MFKAVWCVRACVCVEFIDAVRPVCLEEQSCQLTSTYTDNANKHTCSDTRTHALRRGKHAGRSLQTNAYILLVVVVVRNECYACEQHVMFTRGQLTAMHAASALSIPWRGLALY